MTIVLKPASDSDQLEVHGRGELQLGILIEEMRREGYELCVSPPRVLEVLDAGGKEMEPVEEVTIDVDTENSGTVIERLQMVRALMDEYKEMGDRVRMVFHMPSRLLMGVRARLRTDIHGSAVVNAMFLRYDPIQQGDVPSTNDKVGGAAFGFTVDRLCLIHVSHRASSCPWTKEPPRVTL